MTALLADQLNSLYKQAKQELVEASTASQLESWRVRYLGRKGLIPTQLRLLSRLALNERRQAGLLGNKIRQDLQRRFDLAQEKMVTAVKTESPAVGSSLVQQSGHFNPLTLSIRRLYRIFTALGFQVAEGPLLEEPRYNFDLLNMPLEHPARAATDTFYVAGGKYCLRTHTSPVQIRAVLEHNLQPPFKVFSPGRVFRAEKIDASHQHTFYQVEALMVGPTVTIADFKGIVEHLYSEFFSRPITIRLRPSFFPFVEPGFEVDISCPFCRGQGCRLCRHSNWLEVMGAGMVHPNVLTNMNLDPERYQGFAFGSGIDRLAMLLFGIDDIRYFLNNDLRFSRQF